MMKGGAAATESKAEIFCGRGEGLPECNTYMLLGEEFAKRATDRVEAVKAINKMSASTVGLGSRSSTSDKTVFSITTSELITQTVAGMVTEMAPGGAAPTQSITDATTMVGTSQDREGEFISVYKEFTKYCSMYSVDQRTSLNEEGIKYDSACRANQPVHTKLGTNYTRHMGTASSPGVQTPVGRKSRGTTGTTRNALTCITGKASTRGSGRVNPKGAISPVNIAMY